MTILSLFPTLIARMIARAQAQRSLGAILDRPEDHLLDDIGLTRAEAAALLRDPLARTDPYGGQVRMSADVSLGAAGGAGFSRWVISGSHPPM